MQHSKTGISEQKGGDPYTNLTNILIEIAVIVLCKKESVGKKLNAS